MSWTLGTILVVASVTCAANGAWAAQFNPTDATVSAIAERFALALKKEGITGVGKDVLKCYDENLANMDATKECVVYDTAALMLDRQMMQIFVARGMNAVPSTLYTNQAFDARMNAYGFRAFANETEKKMVGPAATRVLNMAVRQAK